MGEFDARSLLCFSGREKALFHQLKNLLLYPGHRITSVNLRHAFGFAARNIQEPIQHALMEGAVFLLKTIFVIRGKSGLLTVSLPRALDAVVKVRHHEDGQVRLQVMAQYFVQLQYSLGPQLAPAALVGLTGISKTVTQHPLALLERRQDLLVNVLRAVGEHKRHFRQRRQSGCPGTQKHRAQVLPQGRPAGLARGDDVQATFTQPAGQVLQLR